MSTQRPVTVAELTSKAGKAWWNSLTDEEKRARIEKLTKARRKKARERKQSKAA